MDPSEKIESRVKDEVLAVFRTRKQLTRCARNIKEIDDTTSILLEQLICLLKEPVVDSLSREILHHCRLIVETMVNRLLQTCKIPYSSTLHYQLKWLKKACKMFGPRNANAINRWTENVRSIKEHLNIASHATSKYLSISIVLSTIEVIYSLASNYPSIITTLIELTKNSKTPCRFFIMSECKNLQCTFAHQF